jgi:hypothetical protein
MLIVPVFAPVETHADMESIVDRTAAAILQWKVHIPLAVMVTQCTSGSSTSHIAPKQHHLDFSCAAETATKQPVPAK